MISPRQHDPQKVPRGRSDLEHPSRAEASTLKQRKVADRGGDNSYSTSYGPLLAIHFDPPVRVA